MKGFKLIPTLLDFRHAPLLAGLSDSNVLNGTEKKADCSPLKILNSSMQDKVRTTVKAPWNYGKAENHEATLDSLFV